MSLVQRYAFSTKLFDGIGYAHNLDPCTRFRIRLGNVKGVQRIYAPQLAWDTEDSDFVFLFPVERQAKASWDAVSADIKTATQQFFAAFSVT